MSLRSFIGLLTLLIAGGLGAATYLATLTYGMQPNWTWIIAYFLVSIPGIILSAKSDNWMVSLLGYAMVITPTGLLIGPYVSLYTVESVFQVLLLTIGVTVAIGAAGALYPKSVKHWGGFLFTGLLVIIFGDFARIFMVELGFQPVSMKIWDWLAALLFCLFIFYDMNRAVRLNRTIDNAVDAAVKLYLDIINLFIRLLASKGERGTSW